MDKTSMIISVILLIGMIILYAPGIIASNRGRLLRNIALWLGVFVGLTLFYKNFGPHSPHPLFAQPEGMTQRIADPPDTDNGKKDTVPATSVPEK